jgi:hypothetical protein
MEGVVSINGRDFRYRVVRNSVKHAYIKLKRDLQIEVVVPKKVNGLDVENLILEKKDWIEKKAEEIERSLRIYKDGKVLFKGKEYEVVFERGERDKVLQKGSKFVVQYSDGDPVEILLDWLKERAKKELVREVESWSKKLGIEPNNVRIKEMKTRWGSCTKKWNVSINWQVIVLPKRLRDYVIVHELIHLSELNHSKRFWARLAEVFPDYQELRRELKKYAIMGL